jgi:hypothetical protein
MYNRLPGDDATVFTATGGDSGICAGAVAGMQVIIKDPPGKLPATTSLVKDSRATAVLGLVRWQRRDGVLAPAIRRTLPQVVVPRRFRPCQASPEPQTQVGIL